MINNIQNCRNCNIEVDEKDSFCRVCGAKIVKKRITLKSLFSNIVEVLGWDSNFFVTLRFLLYKPQVVIQEYIGGTRKKHTNPFAFYAILIAVSLFIYSQFSEQIIDMSTQVSLQRIFQKNYTPKISTALAISSVKTFCAAKYVRNVIFV